jgi:hypothetical protein
MFDNLYDSCGLSEKQHRTMVLAELDLAKYRFFSYEQFLMPPAFMEILPQGTIEDEI